MRVADIISLLSLMLLAKRKIEQPSKYRNVVVRKEKVKFGHSSNESLLPVFSDGSDCGGGDEGGVFFLLSSSHLVGKINMARIPPSLPPFGEADPSFRFKTREGIETRMPPPPSLEEKIRRVLWVALAAAAAAAVDLSPIFCLEYECIVFAYVNRQ